MDKAFRGELTKKWRKGDVTSEELTGDVPFALPNGWKWASVEEVCEDVIDCPHSTPKYIDEGSAIRTSDIGFAAIDLLNARKVSEEEFLIRTKRTVPKYGDVIYCREGTIGNAGMVEDQKLCLAQRVVLLRPDNAKVDHKYFVYGMNSTMVYKQALNNVSQTTSPRVNVSVIKKFMIPIAPKDEQTRIVKIIDKLLEKESKINKIDISKEMLIQLEQAILSMAFRGELGTNNSNESVFDELDVSNY